MMSRDIDRIIEIVKSRIPDVDVSQLQTKYPADDDGLWFFQLPGIWKTIQLESSFGVCPFIVGHSGMATGSDAWNAQTVDEAVQAVVTYLEGVRAGSS
ncbi:MAG: hypothetical protein HY290_26960 [Planctomycetia bacterium]|nr:hypothetical protein [Planctomycetia bacterium]